MRFFRKRLHTRLDKLPSDWKSRVSGENNVVVLSSSLSRLVCRSASEKHNTDQMLARERERGKRERDTDREKERGRKERESVRERGEREGKRERDRESERERVVSLNFFVVQ